MTSPQRTLPAPRRGRRFWPAFIVGLIALNGAIVAVTIYFAVGDESVAIEPDYYAKALRFDDVMRAKAASDALGWIAAPTLTRGDVGRAANLTITLADGENRPISDAVVTVEAFANARAARRQSLDMVRCGDGSYCSPIMIDRSGIWQLRITARRGDDVFTRQTELMISDAPTPQESGR